MRDYDHLEPAAARCPAVVHEGPPPGVHMPGPSIRPLLGALGSAALLGGLVVGGWVLILAVVFLVYTLIGWLVDFTAEYRKVEEADRTGHLENIPTARLPVRTLQVFAVLFVLVGLWPARASSRPPRRADGGGARRVARRHRARRRRRPGAARLARRSSPRTSRSTSKTLEAAGGQAVHDLLRRTRTRRARRTTSRSGTAGRQRRSRQCRRPTAASRRRTSTTPLAAGRPTTSSARSTRSPAMTGTLTVK